LFANDALLILDEAHTSAAFSQTLAAIGIWKNEAHHPPILPFHSIQLTATPSASAAACFELSDAEKADPAVVSRLSASKPTHLLEIPGAKRKDRHKKIAGKIAELAGQIFSDNATRRMLVVVNRVETAKVLYQSLKSSDVTTAMLVGGMRPLDCDAILDDLIAHFHLQSPGGYRGEERLVLIATQCVEVGADLDFDALATELAPLDALRQRFGRLNRYGRDTITPAVIFAPEESLISPDPVYGNCLPDVWKWLEPHKETLDFGISAFSAALPAGDALTPLLAPQAPPPVLLPAHLDLLCQTSPAPHVEPEPALYIHGPIREFPVISVIVRDDLLVSRNVADLLTALPPLATESASVSLLRAKSWLTDEPLLEEFDVPAEPLPKPPRPTTVKTEAWIYRNGITLKVGSTGDLMPGDILVIPADTPNLEKLIPSRGKPEDQCEAAHLLARDKLLVVLSDQRLARWECDELTAALSPIREEERRQTEEGVKSPFPWSLWNDAKEALLKLSEPHLSPIAPFISRERDWQLEPHPEGGIILRGRTRVGFTPWPLVPDELGAQGNEGPHAPLVAHQADVAKRVTSACKKLGIDKDLTRALELAALYHDIGKADPRFQAWLHGCGVWEVAQDNLLAKSSYPRIHSMRFRTIADVPSGFRHELLSTAILMKSAVIDELPERDLLLHLVASHHGYCRGTTPIMNDPDPESFDVEIEGETIHYTGDPTPLAHIQNGVPERFWVLNRRFGRWGIAYLETILRIADQRASAAKSHHS
jgi:CRISPR-associated endonuclease/helicase Cas3